MRRIDSLRSSGAVRRGAGPRGPAGSSPRWRLSRSGAGLAARRFGPRRPCRASPARPASPAPPATRRFPSSLRSAAASSSPATRCKGGDSKLPPIAAMLMPGFHAHPFGARRAARSRPEDERQLRHPAGHRPAGRADLRQPGRLRSSQRQPDQRRGVSSTAPTFATSTSSSCSTGRLLGLTSTIRRPCRTFGTRRRRSAGRRRLRRSRRFHAARHAYRGGLGLAGDLRGRRLRVLERYALRRADGL